MQFSIATQCFVPFFFQLHITIYSGWNSLAMYTVSQNQHLYRWQQIILSWRVLCVTNILPCRISTRCPSFGWYGNDNPTSDTTRRWIPISLILHSQYINTLPKMSTVSLEPWTAAVEDKTKHSRLKRIKQSWQGLLDSNQRDERWRQGHRLESVLIFLLWSDIGIRCWVWWSYNTAELHFLYVATPWKRMATEKPSCLNTSCTFSPIKPS